jgi:hypothetical protein
MMALTIFMCGHGDWKPKDGFIQLPAWVTMSFVVDFSKVLYTTDMYKVCEGTFGREFARTIGELGTHNPCPNMTWTADDEAKIGKCDQALKLNKAAQPAQVLFPNHFKSLLTNNTITLKKFFEDFWEPVGFNLSMQFGSTHFIWNCCSYTSLKPSAKGAEIGINAAHGATKYDHVDYTHGVKFLGKTSSL